MTEGDFLLREIIERPDDDGLRKIYADWLEGEGQPLRAEFIRVQVLGAAAYEMRKAGWKVFAAYREASERANALGLKMFLRPFPSQWLWAGIPEEPATEWAGSLHGDLDAILPESGKLCWRRGFIDRVEITLNGFFSHAETLFTLHPVSDVRLTDVRPVQHFSGVGHIDDPDQDLNSPQEWRFAAPVDWPGAGAAGREELLSALRRPHPSWDDAVHAMADECLAHGRSLRRLAWEGVHA